MSAKTKPPPPTPAQIRAARALADWSQQELADAAKLSLSTVRDYEKERRGGDIGGIQAIRRALENVGVQFLAGGKDAGPGVRLTVAIPAVLRMPHRLSDDALLIPIEWRGRAIDVFVTREVLEDLGRIKTTRELSDSECVALFSEHRTAILTAAAAAIDNGRVTPDRRVHLAPEDIPELS